MECTNNTTLIGESWSLSKPSPYPLELFEFIPSTGLHGRSAPALRFEFALTDSIKYLDSIEEIKEEFPHSMLVISISETCNFKLEISNWALYDFDFQLAMEIEKILKALDLQEKLGAPSNNGEWNTTYLRPTILSKPLGSMEKGFSWIGNNASDDSGLEPARIRVQLHHKGRLNEKEFFDEILTLLDESKIEYLEYRSVSNNYMLHIGNGRLGLLGMPVKCIDVDALTKNLLSIIIGYGLELDLSPALSGYGVVNSVFSEFIKIDPTIVKDERSI